MAQKEKVRVNNISIEKLINSDLLQSIKKLDENIIPISIVFLKKPATPILVGHENQNEIDNKLIHINCLDESILDKMTKILEKNSDN